MEFMPWQKHLLLLILLLLQAGGLHNQVANDLGTLTERQI